MWRSRPTQRWGCAGLGSGAVYVLQQLQQQQQLRQPAQQQERRMAGHKGPVLSFAWSFFPFALCLQVLQIGDSFDGRLGIMYGPAQPPAAAGAAASNGGGPHIEDPPLPAMLLADAVVLAAGGFAANKQMLQVCCRRRQAGGQHSRWQGSGQHKQGRNMRCWLVQQLLDCCCTCT